MNIYSTNGFEIYKTEEVQIQIKEWVRNLRHGNFPQTKGGLQDNVGFCCLGVACHLFIPEHLKISYDGKLRGGLPENQPEAPSWLKRINRDILDLGLIMGIAALNDDHNYTFPMIADVIEEKFLKEKWDGTHDRAKESGWYNSTANNLQGTQDDSDLGD